MKLPFTAQQFFDVFVQYNQSVWPAQIILNLAALAAIVYLFYRRSYSGRLISGTLALLWAWTGIIYHLIFFMEINKAALVFGIIFLFGSGAFLWAGVIKNRLHYDTTNFSQRILGAGLIGFGLIIYPLLSWKFGHSYPAMPTFGLPCPTTIFTIGILCFLCKPYPRYVWLAPVLWSVIGSQAAFLLGVYQDLGLLVAGIIGLLSIIRHRRNYL